MASNHFKISRGITLLPQSGAPADPQFGDIYLDATLGLQYYDGAVWGPLAGGAGVAYDAVAGETLSANIPVYISQGGSADAGRTAGRVYMLDPTNDARVEFVGFTTESKTVGQTIEVQLGGELDGFSALTVGEPIYATGAGTFGATAPTTLNHWIIQLGVVSAADKVLVNGAGSATAVKITTAISASVYPDFSRPLKFVAGSTVSVENFNNSFVMNLPNSVNSDIYSEFVVPQNYITGTELALLLPFAINTSGNLYFTIVSDLYRTSTASDVLSSVPSARRSATYTVSAPANTYGVSSTNAIKLTDSLGKINGVAINPGDMIVFNLQRTATSGNDTAEAALKLFDAELSYKGSAGLALGGSGSGGDGFDSLVEDLEDIEAGTESITPNEIFDSFQTNKGTKTNTEISSDTLRLVTGQNSGTYERIRETTTHTSQVTGVATITLLALAPKNTTIAANVIKFTGDVTDILPVGTDVIIYKNLVSDGERVHVHLLNAVKSVARLPISACSYNSGTNETSLTVTNTDSLDLSMGLSSGSYNTTLRVSPFDYAFEVKSTDAGGSAYEEMDIADAHALDEIGIPGETGAWAEIGNITGTIIKSHAKLSPNREYGVARVMEAVSGNYVYHWFYKKAGAWTKFSTTATAGTTYAEDYPAYYVPGNDFVVANNGKCFLTYTFFTGGSYKVKALYGDISAGSPSLTDTAALGTDALNSDGSLGYIVAAGANSVVTVGADLVDLSYIAIAGNIHSPAAIYMRWFTNGGATHVGISASSDSHNLGFNPAVYVTGTGSSHRTTLVTHNNSSNFIRHTYWDQGSLSAVGSGNIETTTNYLCNYKNLDNKAYFTSTYNVAEASYYSATLNGTPAWSARRKLASIRFDHYVGFNLEDMTWYNQRNEMIVIDPANSNHVFIAGDLVHPDGCRRAALFEIADDTDFKGVQISNYGTGSGASLKNTSSQARISQSFTAGSGQRLRTFTLRCYQVGSIATGNTMSATLQTASGGIPTGTVVATATNTYDPSLLTKSSSGQFIYFNFPTYSLTNGQEYAIVLDATYSANNTDYVAFLASAGNAFAGDQRLYNGSSWVDNTSTDLILEVHGEWAYDVSNASHNTNNREGRDRHNMSTQIALISDTAFSLVTRKVKNHVYSTTADAFETTGHLYKRTVTINAPGTAATVGAFSGVGYDGFDDNLKFSTSLGTTECTAVTSILTGALSTTDKGEDRSGWNIPATNYVSMTYAADSDFESGQCGVFSGSGYIQYKLLPGLNIGPTEAMVIEAEIKPTGYANTPTICSQYLGGGNNYGFIFGIDSSGYLYMSSYTTAPVHQQAKASDIVEPLTYHKVRAVLTPGGVMRLYRSTVAPYTTFTEVASYSVQQAHVQMGSTGVFSIGTYYGSNTSSPSGQFTGRIGYVKIITESTAFASDGFNTQPPQLNHVNLGTDIVVQKRIGENAEALGTNYDAIGTLSSGSEGTLVDSYKQYLLFNHAIDTANQGQKMHFKLSMNRGAARNTSSYDNINFRFAK